MADVIRVHQYTDGPTGHVNVEFIRNGTSLGFYGSNTTGASGFGLAGGVYKETSDSQTRIRENPGNHSFSDIGVSSGQFNSALSFAQGQANLTKSGAGNYDIVCRNCVDFAGAVLGAGGMSRFSIGAYLIDGTLTDIYANTVMYLCNNAYDDLMDSYPGGLGLEYMDQYYMDVFGVNVSWDFDMFWTSEYLALYDYLSPMFGLASWDRYLDDFSEDYAANGSPIVIDLQGDGISTLSPSDVHVRFDLTGDGVKDRVGWLDGSDGFIVRDLNGNGAIDGVHEMFGGMHRGEGYGELAELDGNRDGVISMADADFTSLLVWQDLNVDSITDQGELRTLSEAGVSLLSLRYASVDNWQNENFIGESSFALRDGREVEMADVYFRLEQVEHQARSGPLLSDLSGVNAQLDGSRAAPMGIDLGGWGGSEFRLNGLGATRLPVDVNSADAQAASLVQAMASMAPPVMDASALTTVRHTGSTPVLAANWC